MTLSLSGRLDADVIAELRRLFDQYTDGRQLILDLSEVGLVERGAIRPLAAFESYGIWVINCPTYVHDWMSMEAGEKAT